MVDIDKRNFLKKVGIAGIAGAAFAMSAKSAFAETVISGSSVQTDAINAPTGRSATLVVAASDSSAKSKAQADYVCDGVNDQIEIQAAIDTLQKGNIVLLDGTYNLNPETSFYEGDWYAALFLENKSDIIVEGRGAVLSLPNSATVKNFALAIEAPCSNIKIQQLKFDCTGSTSTTNQGAIFYNSSVGSSGYITNLAIQDCTFDGGRSFVIWGDGENARRFNVLNNFFTSSHINSYGIACHNSPSFANISNNIFNVAGGIFLDSMYGVNITNNVMSGIRANGIYSYDYVRECIISNNYIETALDVNSTRLIYLDDKNSPERESTRNTISNNYLKRVGGASHGIYIKRGTDNTIFDNRIYNLGVPLFDGGSGNKKYKNEGYETENTGTATITTGQTTVDVTHGLAAAPTRILLSPTTATAGKQFYVSAKAATTFTITVDSAAGADISFDWQAIV